LEEETKGQILSIRATRGVFNVEDLVELDEKKTSLFASGANNVIYDSGTLILNYQKTQDRWLRITDYYLLIVFYLFP